MMSRKSASLPLQIFLKNRYSTGTPIQASPFSLKTTHVGLHASRFQVLRFMSSGYDVQSFRAGDQVQVEVVSFGPLGASVEVVGLGHSKDAELLPADQEPYGFGLILQKEIAYFRQGRNNLDVVLGEILPAYIQNVRDDGKLDLGLRVYGGKAKSQEVASMIMDRLSVYPELPVGDKSKPEEINKEFPGVSKTAFKKAVGALYKKGLIVPSAQSIKLK